jgi:hypothetical protein
MSYTLAQLQQDSEFIALQSKAIQNLMRLIYSTTADFTLLNSFISNWITYINDNPSVDPSGNLLYILTNTDPPANGSGVYTGSGIYNIISTYEGSTNARIYSAEIYPFVFIQYITNLTSSDTSYTAIVEFFNELIAL